jgi:hypothetical protein
MNLVDDPTVVYIFGRLRAHQTSMVAAVSDEEGVVSRSLSPQNSIPFGRWLDRHNVARSQPVESRTEPGDRTETRRLLDLFRHRDRALIA